MRILLMSLIALTLTSCAMMGSREDALKNSMSSMTKFKGEIFYKNEIYGSYKEIDFTAESYAKALTHLQESKLLPTPGITEYPTNTIQNPLLKSVVDMTKSAPTPTLTKYLEVFNKDGKKIYDLYVVMNPYSINDKTNAVEHEAWVVFANGTKNYTEKVKDADKGTLEYYYFDEKWPSILQKLI